MTTVSNGMSTVASIQSVAKKPEQEASKQVAEADSTSSTAVPQSVDASAPESNKTITSETPTVKSMPEPTSQQVDEAVKASVSPQISTVTLADSVKTEDSVESVQVLESEPLKSPELLLTDENGQPLAPLSGETSSEILETLNTGLTPEEIEAIHAEINAIFEGDGLDGGLSENSMGLIDELIKSLGADIPQLPDTDDTVAVLDFFQDFNGFNHGEYVSGIIDSKSQSVEVDNIFKLGLGGPRDPQPDAPVEEFEPGSLKEMIVKEFTAFLDDTSDNLEQILANPGNIKVINQSAGVAAVEKLPSLVTIADEVNPGSVMGQLYSELKTLLTQEMGMSVDTPQKDYVQGVINYSMGVLESSTTYQYEKNRFDNITAQLAEKGISYVIAAGNFGEYVDELEGKGFSLGNLFVDSINANQHIFVATGTQDMNGTPSDITDDVPAGLSTPESNATVSLPAVGVTPTGNIGDPDDFNQVKADGNSFAAPQLTALIADMKNIRPDLTNSDIKTILKLASKDTEAPQSKEGFGILNPKLALELIQNSVKANPQAVVDADISQSTEAPQLADSAAAQKKENFFGFEKVMQLLQQGISPTFSPSIVPSWLAA